MKINFLTLITISLFLFTKFCNAQDASVEKTTFGIQTGVLGLWLHNEMKISDKVALRLEMGIDSGLFGGDIYNKTGFIMTPVETVNSTLSD